MISKKMKKTCRLQQWATKESEILKKNYGFQTRGSCTKMTTRIAISIKRKITREQGKASKTTSNMNLKMTLFLVGNNNWI